jgi:nucleoside-diphosphate-sugar epimerase
MTTTVLLAGGTGMLGSRIAEHLLEQPHVAVRLLVRPAGPEDATKVTALQTLVAKGAVPGPCLRCRRHHGLAWPSRA